MTDGMLAVAVFCMFAFGFYIADKVDQFLGEIHECKRQYKEEEIRIFDGKEETEKRVLTIRQSHDIISKTVKKGGRKDEFKN